MLAPLLVVAPAVAWYGPVSATFNITVSGNPFDPAVNDLKVRFMPAKGAAEERFAYVDYDGTVKATLVTQNPGQFRAVLVRNGKDLFAPPEEGLLDASRKLSKGFLRVHSLHKNRFMWDSGEAYLPLGLNLGGEPPLTDQVGKLAGAGANWARLTSRAEGMDPWRPGDKNDLVRPDSLWPKALATWEAVVDVSDLNNVALQMALFSHDSFASEKWPSHPWNTANGGFLREPGSFFVDAEAKRRAKIWLRYAVARYGHSANLMAWELFDQAERISASAGDIAAWHQEMAEYVRSIDPYDHLITTSSQVHNTELDYYQPKLAAETVLAGIVAFPLPTDKPVFFGDIFQADSGGNISRDLKNAIYGSLLSNLAGAGSGSLWDLAEQQNLWTEFSTAAAVLRASGLADRATARRLKLSVPGAEAMGLGESDWALFRVTRSTDAGSALTIKGISLADGQYDLTTFDLASGQSVTVRADVNSFTLSNLPLPHDSVLVLKRVPPPR